MANDKHAYITIQGNTSSRKLYDPSGYVVMSPYGVTTRRTLKAAVLCILKKGCVPHLVKPVKPSGQAALLQEKFNIALEEVEQEMTVKAEAEALAHAEDNS